MYFDTHAHFDSEKFEGDRLEVLASMPAAGVDLILDPGSDIITSRAALSLAEQFDFVYAAAGVHPHEAEEVSDSYLADIEELCRHPKVKAIGEIGLDYYYDNSERDVQRYWFKRQLELAREIDVPVSIHSRDAMEDTINILAEYGSGDGIIHCYSGSKESAKILLGMGYYISFAGPVTFKNASTALEVIRYVPNDRMLIETDSPYLAPVPYRGKRNCPLYVPEVAKKISEIKGMEIEDVARITAENAKKVYRIR